jgi:hypothetical protein
LLVHKYLFLFTSLRTKDGDTILNLEHGITGIQWGWVIFHASDVDRFSSIPHGKGLSSGQPTRCLVGRTHIFICPIMMAMSFHLLIRYSRFPWCNSNLIALLPWKLFTYRVYGSGLIDLLTPPLELPPDPLEFFDLDSMQPT